MDQNQDIYAQHFIRFLREQNDNEQIDEKDSLSDSTSAEEEDEQNKSVCQQSTENQAASTDEPEPQQKKSKLVVELVDPPRSPETKQYRFKAIFIARNFKGQKHGDNVGELQIMADSVDVVLTDIWTFALRFIQREVCFKYSQSESSSTELEVCVKESGPVIEDIDKFIMFSDKVSKRYHAPSSVKSKLLHSWFSKDVNVFLYRYSLAVTSLQQWEKVKSQQTKPSHADRSGAPSNVLLADLCAELKEIHREHYVSDNINWSIWATYILKQPAHLRSQLMSSGPPESMMRLFRPVPLHSDTILEKTQHELKIAKNIVDFFGDEVKDMRTCFNNLGVIMQQMDMRITAVEHKVGEYRKLLTSVSETVAPQESLFSKSVAEEVPDCVDVDHC